MKVTSFRELRASGLVIRDGDSHTLVASDEENDEEEEGSDEEADEVEPEEQGVPSPVHEDFHAQHQDAPGHQSFDFSDWGRQLGLIHESQQRMETSMGDFGRQMDQFGVRLDTFDDHQQQMAAHQLYMADHQRRMESQLNRIEYDQTFFRPFMTDWAERQAEAQHRPMPQYRGPDIFIPTQQYGGFVYPPPQQRSGAGTSSSGQRPVFPMFGSYTPQHDGDGEPSVFGTTDDMQE